MIRMRHRVFCIGLYFFLVCNINLLNGQHLVSAEWLGQRTKSQIEATIGYAVRSDVTLYKILYLTADVVGSTDTASGLLVVPEQTVNGGLPVVIYQHGTTNGPDDSPSRLAAGTSEALAYGGMGYITLAPDYLGLGDSRGFHPYVHAASEAWAAVDMLLAVAEWLSAQSGDNWNDQLFITGYSQGGHAAAALHRLLESQWSNEFPVTASTPMSGPYSISGIMYDRIISDEIYFVPAYIAYVTLSYQTAYGNLYSHISEIFKPGYVAAIEDFHNRVITTSTLNLRLLTQLFLETGTSRPKHMFRDEVLQALIGDENHPLRVALRDNDVMDWAPVAPTRLYYCTADEQVPYQNTLVAEAALQARGAPDVLAVNFGALSHGNCAPPAIQASVAFFDGFALSTKIMESNHSIQEVFLYPNPAKGLFFLLPNYRNDVSYVHIFDSVGIPMLRCNMNTGGDCDIATLSPGLYFAQAQYGTRIIVQKLLVQ
jgi:hypothetical protein